MTDADSPRDPWGNPIPDGVRPPNRPPAGQDPHPARDGVARTTPGPDPAWPGRPRDVAPPPPDAPPPPPQPPSSWVTTPPGSTPTPGGWPPAGAALPPPPTPRPRVAGTAIAALVCGIASILCVGVLGVVLGPTAIGLGVGARRTTSRSNGWRTGDGMATAGIVCGIIGTVLGLVYLVFILRNPDFLTNLLNDLTSTTTTGKLQGA